jgi:hypothetical protein
MKTTMKTMLVIAALGAAAFIVNAQDAGGPPPGGDRPFHPQGGPGGPGGPGGQGGPGGPRRMGPAPLMEALDANHDGVIDATEIANASAALKALDKNGDGKLTQEELRPPGQQGGGRPPGQQGGGRPPGRPPGPNGPPQQNPPPEN